MKRYRTSSSGYGGYKRRRITHRKRSNFVKFNLKTKRYRRSNYRRYRRTNLNYIYGKFQTQSIQIPAPANGIIHFNCNFSPKDILQQVGVADELQPYFLLSEQIKVNKIIWQFYLNDNDELVKADETIAEIRTAYDSNSSGKILKDDQIQKFGNSKMLLMRPFQKYKVQFSPRFTIENALPGGPNIFIKNSWLPVGAFSTQSDAKSVNSVHVDLIVKNAETPAIYYTATYYMSFKGRKPGVVYQ